MGGQVSRYTINLVVNEETVYPLAKGSLEQIDEITTKYVNKNEFVAAIAETFNINVKGKSTRMNITYNQNKKIRYMRVLYFDNKEVLNKNEVAEKVLYHSANTDFVKQYVKRYCNSPYLSSLASEVIGAINAESDYVDCLQRIIDLTFGSYKSIRDIYLFIKEYEAAEKRDEPISSTPQLDAKKDLLNYLKTLKVIRDYQQLNLFDTLGDQSDYTTDNGTPKIIKRK